MATLWCSSGLVHTASVAQLRLYAYACVWRGVVSLSGMCMGEPVSVNRNLGSGVFD